jgi:cell division protein FtsB
MAFINKLPSWIRNKYLLTSAGFLVWIVFFDERDLITTLQYRSELKALEASRDYYISKNNEISKELEQLKSNPATAEKYAREKFRMKKDNEDIFIIPESASPNQP